MEEIITITELNDFIFCPISIYFHNLYGNIEKILYQRERQLSGSAVHKAIDEQKYSSKKAVLQGEMVYSSIYNIIGRIDIFDIETEILAERKNKIEKIYDGYVLQLYAQYFALKEMGYSVKKLKLHSMLDNKNYYIDLPENNKYYLELFENTLNNIRNFNLDTFIPENKKKCINCIYSDLCDRCLL